MAEDLTEEEEGRGCQASSALLSVACAAGTVCLSMSLVDVKESHVCSRTLPGVSGALCPSLPGAEPDVPLCVCSFVD